MRIAVDSSVLLDVLGGDQRFGEASREALRRAYDSGALVACEVVWAEVRAQFAAGRPFEEALALLGVGFLPLTSAAAALAGQLWRDRRRAGGGRGRVVADLLIGAHALLQTDGLLTRDRGFYRSSFARLHILDPARSMAE